MMKIGIIGAMKLGKYWRYAEKCATFQGISRFSYLHISYGGLYGNYITI